MLPTLDPELLQTFITIAETGSFQRAAKQVNLTQSAVSMQINRLEKMLGCELFLRERPTVRLTEKGEILLGYAQRILQLRDEAWERLAEPQPAGLVRFGIPDDYAMGVLPQILERFASRYPQIEVVVRCATSLELVTALDAGALDLALISRTPTMLMGRIVKHEQLVWACSAHHAAHLKNPLPLAVFQEDCYARQCATLALAHIGRPYRIAYSSPNLAALLAVTSAGLAVAAMPSSSVPPHFKILGKRDGFPPLPEIDLALVQNANDASSAVNALAECIDFPATSTH